VGEGAGIIPAFGHFEPGIDYALRPGGYVLVFDPVGALAVLPYRGGLMLPGGGVENGESPEAAALREAYEECGLRLRLRRALGSADEGVYSVRANRHYRKRCSFFLAELLSIDTTRTPEFELRWVSRPDAAAGLRHESQRWALTRADAPDA
jgi:8-oxo-dGTP diphosphatase